MLLSSVPKGFSALPNVPALEAPKVGTKIFKDSGCQCECEFADGERGQRTALTLRPISAPLAKPSRHGEERLGSDLVCAAVRRWFKQPRRLQSLVHALRSDKLTAEAIAYRVALGLNNSCAWFRRRVHDMFANSSFTP